MATSKDYISFITEQLSALGDIKVRQMMGEYIIYYRGKIAAYVCDNRLLVKLVPAAEKYLPGARHEPPYDGATNMLLVEEVVLAEDETGGSLGDKLCEVGAVVLLKTLEELPKNTLVPKKQPKESPTPYAVMLTKEMGQINWDRSAAEIERLVRGLNPWPSAYTHLNGKTLKIWKASVEEGQAEEAQNGEIVSVTKKELLVKTGEGLLSLDEVQLEGKKRMPADAFLRGYAVEKGVLLK